MPVRIETVRLKDAWAETIGDVSQRLSALQSMQEQTEGKILAAEIKKLWSRWMVLARCRLFVMDNGPAAIGADAYTPEMHLLRVVCQATADNLQGDIFTDLDPADPKAKSDMDAYLGALQAAGVLTEAQVLATWQLGGRTVFPFAGVGLPDLHALGLITALDAGVEE